MKIHHDRSYFSQYVTYFCGRTLIKGRVEIVEDAPMRDTIEKLDHCLRCLYSKRKEKGDEFMILNNYPLVRKVRHPLSGTLKLEIESQSAMKEK